MFAYATIIPVEMAVLELSAFGISFIAVAIILSAFITDDNL